jgi:dienelactone hydrolase
MSIRFLAVAAFVALAACAPAPNLPHPEAGQPSSVAPSSAAARGYAQVPPELSVKSFAEMALAGTGLTLDSVLERGSGYTRHGISYFSNGLRITGIMNIPEGKGPFPLVIFNHGYIDPAVYTQGRGLRREQDYLARRGYAVLHTDYRGHAGSDDSPDVREAYDAGLEYAMDSANAIHAVRLAALPSVDTEHVGMLGHSLGGGVTLNILTGKPDLVDAAVLYAPVSADAWLNFERWRSMREEGDRTRALMGTRETHPDAWNALSSKSMLGEIEAPILLFHGTADKDVPYAWSEDLEQWLLDEGKTVDFVTYDNEGHEFSRDWIDFMDRTADFFDKHLRPAPAIGLAEPLARSVERVTKKPFGIHIDPATSPVQPERFSGYHSGTDYELLSGEDPHEVTVRAVCTGSVVFAGTVNGYGGVLIQSCSLSGEPVTVLYGHMLAISLPAKGTALRAGDSIGVLGAGGTDETDGERAHLHLGIHRGSTIDYRGYAVAEAALSEWVNPEALIRNR